MKAVQLLTKYGKGRVRSDDFLPVLLFLNHPVLNSTDRIVQSWRDTAFEVKISGYPFMIAAQCRSEGDMEITFVNPGADYMLQRIMEFQTEDESVFWSEPLYHFYPQLDKAHAASLSFSERKDYIESTLRTIYVELESTINQKVVLYTQYWTVCKEQITGALSDAFSVNCTHLFHDLRCNVTMNPIMPRFLKEHTFDIFYLSSEKGAIGLALHELVHFIWFYVWNRVFGDSYNEYERPSLKWILSEMVVESVMKDERLRSINPYFPREHGGCIYPYFFDMEADGRLILDTLDTMYKNQSIENFMRNSYAYCQEHEAKIREHIRKSEG